jgi:WD40 repeat protein
VIIHPSAIRFYDVNDYELVKQMQGHAIGIAQSPDGTLVTSFSRDSVVKIWSVAEEQVISELRGHRGNVNAVRFDPTSGYVFSAADDGTARVWNVASGAASQQFAAKANVMPEPVLAFSGDSERVLLATTPREVTQRWNLSNLRLSSVYEGALRLPQSIGSRVLTVGADKITVFDRETEVRIAEIAKPPGSVDARINPNGRAALIVASGKLLHWNVETGYQKLLRDAQAVTDVVFAESGKLFAATSATGLVYVFDTTDCSLIRTFRHESQPISAEFGRSSQRLLVVTLQHRAYVWDVSTNEQPLAVLQETGHWLNRAKLSNDDTTVITYGVTNAREILSWNLESGQVERRFNIETNAFVGLNWHPSSAMAVVASQEKGLYLWDLQTGSTHNMSPQGAAAAVFTRDGSRVIASQAQLSPVRFRQELQPPSLRTLLRPRSVYGMSQLTPCWKKSAIGFAPIPGRSRSITPSPLMSTPLISQTSNKPSPSLSTLGLITVIVSGSITGIVLRGSEYLAIAKSSFAW